MESPEKIKEQFPSICYNCEHNRRPTSDSNTERGYVGCAEYARRMKYDNTSIDFIEEGVEAGEGWVDLRANVFSKSSGIDTNFQLLTKQIKVCTEFSKKK